MPELLRHSRGNPEFARVLDLSLLRDAREFAFDIAPEPAEAEAIARLMGAQAVRKLRLAGRLTPLAQAGWRLDATLGATVIQTCVLTLDPVTTRIDQPVQRRFVPVERGPVAEITIAADEDDEIEPLGPTIDLGLLAVEALALALPAYPRKPGAELAARTFAPDGVAPLEDADVKPFASLASIKDKLGSGP
jgi:uncharacterized metal-binding protein YceD (DUF177 family)